MVIETFYQLLPLGLRVLDVFLSFCSMKEFGDGFGLSCGTSTPEDAIFHRMEFLPLGLLVLDAFLTLCLVEDL